MKTALDLPDDLMKEVKMRAVQQGQKLKDAVAELLRRGLEAPLVSQAPPIARTGFMKGEIQVPHDFDRIGEAEIQSMFGLDK